MLAIDDEEAIEEFRLVDAIADTVGGDVATKLIVKIKQGGSFGYTAVLEESAAALNPAVKIRRVLAQQKGDFKVRWSDLAASPTTSSGSLPTTDLKARNNAIGIRVGQFSMSAVACGC